VSPVTDAVRFVDGDESDPGSLQRRTKSVTAFTCQTYRRRHEPSRSDAWARARSSLL
jgi:hypothetical protein